MAHPDSDRELLTLALALTPAIGGRTLSRILARNDLIGIDSHEFLSLKAETLIEEYRLNKKQAANWASRSETSLDEAAKLKDRMRQFGITVITAADETYPELLETFELESPGVLFVYGNAKILNTNTFTVLSSRKSSPAAHSIMDKCAEEGVSNMETLVTGHGTDEYHRVAVIPLRWGAPRILCLDRGLFSSLGPNLTDEPFQAARMWRFQFDPTTDLVVSFTHPDTEYTGANMVQRDVLIAGLSRRLDFVNINPGGNMEKMARAALNSNRQVRISDAFLGSREWTRYGATMIPL